MPVATEHQPPPFFKRGPAPLARLLFFVALSLSLFVVDLRYHYLDLMRQGVALLSYPLQQLARSPGALSARAGDYFASVTALQEENNELRRRQTELSLAQQRYAQLAQEKDEVGVLGQVTRAYTMQSEVTLVSDKGQAVPVQVGRNGLRGVVFGAGPGVLELRYMPANADVQPGDVLVTSGLDGVYLPGLPVAKVARIDRDATFTFARILCLPAAGVERNTQVLVLGKRASPPPPPAEEAPAAAQRRTTARRPGGKGG
ncbi:MAG: rod shape-determining protein MreC [Betaproteobacteria bacterium]|nr:rod shape-determining protein MreC [Betaproteobacteria bacterium]